MKRFSMITVAVAATLSLSGCSTFFSPAGSTEFSCPGLPQGVVCKTPMAVLKSTDKPLPVTESDLPFGQSVEGKTPAILAAGSPMEGSRPVSAKGRTPVRQAPKVMRIHVASWIDKNDDLHLGSTFYTEIEPRKWAIGLDERNGKGAVIPHRESASPKAIPTPDPKPAAPVTDVVSPVANAASATAPAQSGMPVAGYNLDQ